MAGSHTGQEEGAHCSRHLTGAQRRRRRGREQDTGVAQGAECEAVESRRGTAGDGSGEEEEECEGTTESRRGAEVDCRQSAGDRSRAVETELPFVVRDPPAAAPPHWPPTHPATLPPPAIPSLTAILPVPPPPSTPSFQQPALSSAAMELFPVIPVLHVRLRGGEEAKDTQQTRESDAHSSATALLVVVDESGADVPLLSDGGDEGVDALSSALGVCGLVGQLTFRLQCANGEAEREQSAAIQRALKGPQFPAGCRSLALHRPPRSSSSLTSPPSPPLSLSSARQLRSATPPRGVGSQVSGTAGRPPPVCSSASAAAYADPHRACCPVPCGCGGRGGCAGVRSEETVLALLDAGQ